MSEEFDSKDYWRSIILYGLNTATYKIALAKCLYNFTKEEKTIVSMHDLSVEFFKEFKIRLENGMPQLYIPGRQTKMENIVQRFNLGLVSEEEAISFVENNAFVDVVPRFHTVNNASIPTKFYEYNKNGLILTDSVFEIFSGVDKENLFNEMISRWGLLEAAFQLKNGDTKLINDIRNIYLSKGYERQNITGTIPVLNGYQKGICFYCGESMEGHDIHVDHVIPRQVIYHDDIWNLVLAHAFCNEQKSDALPSIKYINKLIERNEHFIASNHPIKNKLILTMGKTIKERKNYVYKVYNDVKVVIPYTWEGIRGYNPDTDEFYKSFIRSLKKW
ncbi:MAG: HNH endonuclease [Clostridia bacterium]|nr:HNH endonuclease [Clostridia bacterium]